VRVTNEEAGVGIVDNKDSDVEENDASDVGIIGVALLERPDKVEVGSTLDDCPFEDVGCGSASSVKDGAAIVSSIGLG
jgi:hypothetical protein